MQFDKTYKITYGKDYINYRIKIAEMAPWCFYNSALIMIHSGIVLDAFKKSSIDISQQHHGADNINNI